MDLWAIVVRSARKRMVARASTVSTAKPRITRLPIANNVGDNILSTPILWRRELKWSLVIPVVLRIIGAMWVTRRLLGPPSFFIAQLIHWRRTVRIVFERDLEGQRRSARE